MTIYTADRKSAYEAINTLCGRYTDHRCAGDAYDATHLDELLMKLPIATKESLIRYRNDHCHLITRKALLFAETHGTTGVPMQIPRTREQIISAIANYKKIYGRLLHPGEDRVALIFHAILGPNREYSSRALFELSIGQIGMFPIPGVCSFDKIFETLENTQVTTLVATPSVVYKLLFNFRRYTSRQLPSSLSKIFLYAEKFTHLNASNMKKITGPHCDIRPILFGTNELGTIMYGNPDFTYSLFDQEYLFELNPVKDPTQYTSCSQEGAETGRLVVTPLIDSLMPIFRFDTKDVFTTWVDQHGKQTFQYEGRAFTHPLSLIERNAIEDAIYQIPQAVFNFNYKLDQENNVLKIRLVAEPELSQKDYDVLKDCIANITKGRHKIDIDHQYRNSIFLSQATPHKNPTFSL